MKKISKVLVIGSGPIVIGQAAEFDYAGVQACRALKSKKIEIVLVNSNPATIMTDENIADKVYIEPLTLDILEKIIEKEKPDALLSSFGGQTSLNLTCELFDKGILEKFNVQILGSNINSIKNSEDRNLFKNLMQSIGEPILTGQTVSNLQDAKNIAKEIGYPLVIRPAFTLGGSGGAFVNQENDFENAITKGLKASQIRQVLIEKSVQGFKEIEFEVIRDSNDDCIIVCSMENIDAMGIHTGDSMVVAPAQTITNHQLELFRKSAFKIIRALEIVGGCNIQYALNPKSDEYYVIEVNPRVSRSSALASKATGFPIAKVSTLLALGYNLKDFNKDIKKLEPIPDYTVVKFPKFSFQKFNDVDRTLTTSMKSTGEAMAIGKTFEEAFEKGIISTENKILEDIGDDLSIIDDMRIYRILKALKHGKNSKEIAQITNIDKIFIDKFKNLNKNKEQNYFYKITPYCDKENADNAYFYSSKIKKDNYIKTKSDKKKILIIGSGPIRIGQGIEFDYTCVHAIKAIKEAGFDAILVNSNPETLSTDYDIATRLYFEPVTTDYIKNVIEFEKPDGIIVQFGGQTAINLINDLKEYNILGTSVKSLDITENRLLFNNLLQELNIPQPKKFNIKDNITFPVLLRPSYTIGGFGVQIAKNKTEFEQIMKKAEKISASVLIDEYIEGIECEADILSDGENIIVTGFLEHIERTGIHSGDSIAIYPAKRISNKQKTLMTNYALKICQKLNIKGLLNIQYIIKDDTIYVLEVNPRASRTVPILQKMTNYPICEKAVNIMLGEKLKTTKMLKEPNIYAVKMPIFSFNHLPNADKTLGTEMKSTGEVLGIDKDFKQALLKAFIMANIDFKNVPKFSCKDTLDAFYCAKNTINKFSVDTVQNYIV